MQLSTESRLSSLDNVVNVGFCRHKGIRGGIGSQQCSLMNPGAPCDFPWDGEEVSCITPYCSGAMQIAGIPPVFDRYSTGIPPVFRRNRESEQLHGCSDDSDQSGRFALSIDTLCLLRY